MKYRNVILLSCHNQISPTTQIPKMTFPRHQAFSLTLAEFPDVFGFPEIPEKRQPCNKARPRSATNTSPSPGCSRPHWTAWQPNAWPTTQSLSLSAKVFPGRQIRDEFRRPFPAASSSRCSTTSVVSSPTLQKRHEGRGRLNKERCFIEI